MKTTLLILTLLTVLLGCEKKNTAETPDCGCESDIVLSIPNQQDESRLTTDEQTTGWIFYKYAEVKDKYLNYTETDNRFWIIQSGDFEKGRALIVCNESILEKELGYLREKKVYDSVWVSFSGNAKKLCTEYILPAVYGKHQYAEITLTSIKQQ